MKKQKTIVQANFLKFLIFAPAMQERFAEILLPLALPGTLTYSIPEALADSIKVGGRVVVTVGKRKQYTGLVTELHSDETRTAGFEVKGIDSVEDGEPLVSPKQIDFWQWMADYYMCTPGEVMKAALPAMLKKAERIGRAVRKRNEPLVWADVGAEAVESQLSEAQSRALEQIHAAWQGPKKQSKRVCLLHGVTSSGKTEVYIRLIKETLAKGEQVLYLLPEIALTTQITTRLGRVFGRKMGVYHSRFPDGKRAEVYRKQASDAPFELILGVRSALFLPFKRLGLIIVDEEHETSYKQQDPAPRYHARDAAIVLAQQLDAKVLLGTATPSLETYRNACAGKYGKVELTERFGGVEQPQIVVEDIKELRRKKLMKTPFSPRLLDEMHVALGRKEQVILFQNRRGYAPVLSCRSCGWTPRCTACDVSLTYHAQADRLVCHYCGASYPVPKQCPQCGDTELKDLGFGTEKIEEAVRAVFPDARVARMDLDTTRAASSYTKIIENFQRGDTDILIGTQMVTKGLDFDRVSVVGILNADQSLSVPDFRAAERTFHMMAQVAGRAGRRGKRGLVVLQTHQPKLPLIGQVVRGDYTAFYGSQMAERGLFNYPPEVRVIDIHLKHRDDRYAEEAAKMLSQLLRPHFGDNLLGPYKPAVARVQRLFIRKLMLKVPANLSAVGIRQTLLAARDMLLEQPHFKSTTLFFDVDPL